MSTTPCTGSTRSRGTYVLICVDVGLVAISETGFTYSFGQSGQIVFVGSARRESAFVADEFPALGAVIREP
ncbi:hypothetical protein N806_20650 [Rhodococcus sp. P27]|nr:hypothetical protein N806_20650 [Rhodococcus sp. P27]